MINAGFVDFAFTGVGVVPAVLCFAGYLGEAMLLLIPILIAACLFSVYHDQVSTDEPPEVADSSAIERETSQA